jgi:sulfite reductase alpha subunit-like flavoprotein
VSCPAAEEQAPPTGPNEFVAHVLSNEEMLVDAEAGRSTRLITLDIGDRTEGYAPGDHLAIQPANPAPLVEAVCRRFGFAPEDWVRIANAADPRLHAPFPLRRVLTRDVDLSFPNAPEELLAAMRDAAADEGERARLGEWRDALDAPADAPRRRAALDDLAARYLTVLDLLDDHPSSDLDLGALLELSPRLKPRFYSIASSPRREPGRLSIVVGLVRTFADQGRSGVGVCSGYLARVRPGESLRVAVSKPPRRLPDGFDGPLLLIGAGTGIAPLVGALEHRALGGGASTGRAALYFGCRDRGEFLFERRLQQWRTDGALSRLGVAFSRQDGRRTYVQDLLEADGAWIWRLVASAEARILICGDARMADAVCERLTDVAQTHGRMTHERAEDWLSDMRADGRLIEDVWGVNLNRPAAIRKIAEDRYSQGERWFQGLKRRLAQAREREGSTQVT